LISNIPLKTNLLLNKETFYVKSLFSTVSSVGLGLDQAISTLLNNGEIAPGDHTTFATVKFVVSYKYYFAKLDTSVLIDFVYVTKIPCFKNVNECDSFCPPYSKDSNCRSCLDFDGEQSVVSFLNDDEFKKLKHLDHDILSDDGSDLGTIVSSTCETKEETKVSDSSSSVMSKW
jgi:hypothetical protein